MQTEAVLAPGAQLRQVREAAGVHIAALAAALKVPVARLEAIEADRFDLLPDAAFTRALVASICRLLRVESAPILAQLPRVGAGRLADDVRALSGNIPSATGRKAGLSQQFPRPLLWGVLLLLLAAAALMLLPQATMHGWVDALRERMGAEHTEAEVQAPVAPPVEPAAPADVGGTAAQPALAAVPPVVPDKPPAQAAAAPVGAGVPLSLHARGESWVKVTDARGTVVLQKTLAEGESQDVTGVLPLSVIVGRADTTEVQVHGQPFDLAPIVRSNVARFEVK
ncbi:helix-turn-helix domain-containing protein [Xylophilus sp. GW821-FHT01B05]